MRCGGKPPPYVWSASALAKLEKRNIVQILWTALSNGYLYGFAKGKPFPGRSKGLCVPGLNCYSCPGALGACPLGSLQSALAVRSGVLYVTGFLMLFGFLLGRFVCGWLCPFGLLQELLYKIPFVRKLKSLPGEKWLRKVKYVLLLVFVLLMPLLVVDDFGEGSPSFCKYVCPQGTLEGGWLLAMTVPALRSSLGWLFAWKSVLLGIVIVLSLLVWRPFCRYFCPLGVIYGACGKISLFRYAVNEDCTKCGACSKACPLSIQVWKNPNSIDCVKCGKCRKVCPTGAITVQHSFK